MSEANFSGENPPGESDSFLGESMDIPGELPLLPVRDVVIFPYMILPLFVGREKSIEAVDRVRRKDVDDFEPAFANCLGCSEQVVFVFECGQ